MIRYDRIVFILNPKTLNSDSKYDKGYITVL